MKQITSWSCAIILMISIAGIDVDAQQQNPSSQEKMEEKSNPNQEAQTDATESLSLSTEQETQRHPSAETASTVQGVMLASDTIIGAQVRNEDGDAVGEIQRLLISPQYGAVLYAELGVGGFLGMGEKTIMVPWKAIEIARNGDSLVLNTSKHLLKKKAE